MSGSAANVTIEGGAASVPNSQSSESRLAIADVSADESREDVVEEGNGADADISCLLDDSVASSIRTRITCLERISDQQTKYFLQWSKTGTALTTLAGHVALLARAFGVMEKRYGVTPENSMGEYLFKKMEGSIPDEMRRAAADAGFTLSLEEQPQKPTHTVKRRAQLSPQLTSDVTPAKAAKKDMYKPFIFEHYGAVFTSKEQPHIRTDGNMCISYMEGMGGCMLYLTDEGLFPEFPPAVVDAALKAVQKGKHEQQAERLSMFIQHLLKQFIGPKMKLPVVVCAKLAPDAPRESLKAYAASQGPLGGPLLKIGATTTGLVGGDKKLSEADKTAVLDVMQKSIAHLQQVLDHWATGTGRFDVERYTCDDGGASGATPMTAIDVFDD